MRDIEAAYKDALIDEHEGYVRAGRTAEAEQVAEALKDRYDYDVDKRDGDAKKEKEPSSAPERADAEKAPETAVDPKPRRTTRVKPSQGEDK